MSVFQLGANSLNNAGTALNQTVVPGALAQSMNTYMSPYISNVINDSVGRLRDRKAQDMSAIGANAAQGGAFGGSRHGVVEAQTIDNYGRSEDELISRLLQQGFDTSAGLASTELGLMQSGAGGLMNLGSTATGIGQSVNQQQMQAGTMQQQLLQALLGGASGQFDAYSDHPNKQLATLLSSISGNPLMGNVTESYKPGLFDYLGMGAGVFSAGK